MDIQFDDLRDNGRGGSETVGIDKCIQVRIGFWDSRIVLVKHKSKVVAHQLARAGDVATCIGGAIGRGAYLGLV